jgi:hypothetical protein
LSSTTTMLAPISFLRPTAESPSATACTCHHPPLATVNTLPHMDLCAHAVSTRLLLQIQQVKNTRLLLQRKVRIQSMQRARPRW